MFTRAFLLVLLKFLFAFAPLLIPFLNSKPNIVPCCTLLQRITSSERKGKKIA